MLYYHYLCVISVLSVKGRGYSSAVEHATYDQVVPGSNPRQGEAAKAGSGYDLCSCPDDKPQNSFIHSKS